MAKFVPLVIAFLMLGAFSLTLLTGGIVFQAQNNAPVNLTSDPALNAFYQNINSTLFSSSSDTNAANQAFTNSSIQTNGVTPMYLLLVEYGKS